MAGDVACRAWWASFQKDADDIVEMLRVQFDLYKAIDEGTTPPRPLVFWQQTTEGPLRDLARFASDILCLPVSSAEVERSFSEQRKTDTKESAQSSPAYAELRAMLYQNRHIELDEEYESVRREVFGCWADTAFEGRLRSPASTTVTAGELAAMAPVDAAPNGNESGASSDQDRHELVEDDEPFIVATVSDDM